MPDLSIPDFIDLQTIGKQRSLSWHDEESGPKQEVLWTSTCKCKGVF